MSDVVVHGPASWNLVVDLEELPDPTPHMQFALGHRELLGGTSAGKAAHLRDLGTDVVLHTVLGTDAAAAAVEEVLLRAAIPTVATHVDGPTERHLNLMDRDGGRVSLYLDVPHAAELGESLERLLADVARARAVVLDLSEPSRAAIEQVAALGVPLWTDLHDYDGSSGFHAPFLDAASFAFMNGDRSDSPWELLEACVTRGTEVAVCTLGAEGAIAVDAQRVRHRVAAEPVSRVVDTNGAGDGFMAGFLAAHLDGADVPGALRAGARQAARALGTVQLNPILEP